MESFLQHISGRCTCSGGCKAFGNICAAISPGRSLSAKGFNRRAFHKFVSLHSTSFCELLQRGSSRKSHGGSAFIAVMSCFSALCFAALAAHEWLAMPAASAAGLLGGLMRQAIPNKEDLWNFGPFTFLNIPRDVVRLVRHGRMSWELLPLLACVGLELGRVAIAVATKPKWLFAIEPPWDWWLALCVLATLMSVAAPLKIWNNTRIEMNL